MSAAGRHAATPGPPAEGPEWLRRAMVDVDVSWCLLRDAIDAPRHGQDVDLLVHPDEVEAFASALASAGFMRAVRPGRGDRRFYLRYDAEANAWPKIDMVTAISFGPDKEIATNLGPGVLARAQGWGPGLRTASVSDAFWLLLLHELVDKGRVRDRQRARLTALAAGASDDDQPARLLHALRGMDATTLLELVRAGSWGELVRLAGPLRTALRRRQWPAWWLRATAHRALRRLGRYGLWPLRRGLTVAVAGGEDGVRARVAANLASALPLPTRTQRDGAFCSLRARLAARGGRVVITASRRAPARAAEVVFTFARDVPEADLQRQVTAAVWAAYRKRGS